MKTFENAQVGDRVWDVKYGWGKIAKISKEDHLIIVDFDNDIINIYQFDGIDGKSNKTDLNPTLFWNESKIPEEAFEQQFPDLDIDTKVLVKEFAENEWQKRYFAGWTDDGKMKCWSDGRTSWTATDETDYFIWNYWKLQDEKA